MHGSVNKHFVMSEGAPITLTTTVTSRPHLVVSHAWKLRRSSNSIRRWKLQNERRRQGKQTDSNGQQIDAARLVTDVSVTAVGLTWGQMSAEVKSQQPFSLVSGKKGRVVAVGWRQHRCCSEDKSKSQGSHEQNRGPPAGIQTSQKKGNGRHLHVWDDLKRRQRFLEIEGLSVEKNKNK